MRRCSAAVRGSARLRWEESRFGAGAGSVLVLLFAVWLGTGFYGVDAPERAVILRFGKYVQTAGPGYNWHLPWPIERRIIVNVSQQFSVPDDAAC